MKPVAILAPLVILGVIAILVFVHQQDPGDEGSPLPGCALRSATGLHCPGCGATRATHQLMQGDPVAALSHNVLVFPLLILTGYFLLAWGLRVFASRRLPMPVNRWFWLGLGAVMLAFGILRNLPWQPFTWLAP